ncbi:glucose-repressible protein [Aspergillus pseudoviridinutans]|uniref:Glucose-repressible protein n=1 Tax=Aspergillus pseudoviridinutans TaxID=1517512 RepID=A0A9P3ESM0_9EURO|nr:glucose-repressible protein [Aspergillus pseudoviridinutans]GIJ86349.1 glucose-repressible protein [Aspergillus pseudoviridinutans]
MDSIKQGANYVSESVQQALHGSKKEANKDIAKDSDAPIGTRASAAKDAVKDKAHENKHDAKAEAHKQEI